MYVDIYGPYIRKDNRQVIILRFDDGSKTTISYPKWLVEQDLGYRLEDDETVDHINRNFTDNNLENLVVKERKKHAYEDARRARLVVIECAWCGKGAKKRGNDLRHNSKSGKAGPFCSRKCAGRYGAAVQNGRIEPFAVQSSPKSEYYLLRK